MPQRPIERPAYQGSNPISDMWALKAIEMTAQYLPRAVRNPNDDEARAQMLLAASLAGIGFGNAGVHLCHGMSYPVSGMVRDFKPEGMITDHAIIPHGMSVVLTAPSVFRFTAAACPDRHLHAAQLMGAPIADASPERAGHILADQIVSLMKQLEVPNGLSAIGFAESDIPALVEGTLPQHRVTKLSPRPADAEDLARLFKDAMVAW